MQTEKRSYLRLETAKTMQVYTSLCAAAYTVKIDNITPSGALLASKYLPSVGETISFNVCDDSFKYIFSGSGTVKRLVEEDMDYKGGFAVEFDKPINKQTFDNIIQ